MLKYPVRSSLYCVTKTTRSDALTEASARQETATHRSECKESDEPNPARHHTRGGQVDSTDAEKSAATDAAQVFLTDARRNHPQTLHYITLHYITLHYITHYTLYIIYYTLYIIHYTLYIIHYTLYIIHYTLYIIHYSIRYIIHHITLQYITLHDITFHYMT